MDSSDVKQVVPYYSDMILFLIPKLRILYFPLCFS